MVGEKKNAYSLNEINEHIELEKQVRELLEEVKDPEVPVLSVMDLGIIRHIEVNESGDSSSPKARNHIVITITPTYSGCPALDTINMDIRLKLIEKGYRNVTIKQQLSPAWTTDWMSEEGKRKLKEFGIAPPNPKQQFCMAEMFRQELVQCPHCQSFHTEVISQFGSTACKAMYRCLDCKEAFDYFKTH
jgi:ring-1,2-phenylacetyl-CoA epoxidase subunit PaaD